MRLLGNKFFLYFIITTFTVVIFALPLKAANLYFRMEKTAYKTGEAGFVTLNLDTKNKVANAVDAKVKFDPKLIEVTKFVPDKCIINFWVQSPVIDNINGSISFKGLILNPAFNGPLGRLIGFNFKAKAPGSFSFDATDLTVLAHDGKGTSLASNTTARKITITGKALAPVVAVAGLNISSTTHPDQKKWYNKSDVSILWKADKEAEAVAYAFNQEAKFQVPVTAVTEFSSAIERKLISGVWFAHLRVKDKALGWLTTNHFQVNIDTEPPSASTITVLPRQNESFLPVIRVRAKDNLSGIAYYEVWAGAKLVIKDKSIDNLRLKNLVSGKNTIEVKVFDLAGNVRSDKLSVLYNPLQKTKQTESTATPATTAPKKSNTPEAPSKSTPAKPTPTTPATTPKKNYSVLFD